MSMIDSRAAARDYLDMFGPGDLDETAEQFVQIDEQCMELMNDDAWQARAGDEWDDYDEVLEELYNREEISAGELDCARDNIIS